MPTFQYRALKRDGSRAEGSLEALDRSDAFRRLGRQGLQPVALQAVDGGANGDNGGTAVAAPPKKTRAQKKADKQAEKLGAAPAGDSSLTEAKKQAGLREPAVKKKAAKAPPVGPVKLTRNQVLLFTEELSDLLAAGLQLEPALKVMESREELSALKTVTISLRQQVRDGTSFSRALAHASPSFGALYCSMAHAGEVSGALSKILKRQAEYLNTIADLQSKVLFALIYPAFLVLAGISVTVLFVVYLIPQLMGLLRSTGGDLPTAAKILIGTSDFFKAYWWVIILGIIGAVIAFKLWLREKKNRFKWDAFIVRAPLVGGVLSSRFYVQCMETLANLVGNGMPLLKGLELTRDTTMNLYLHQLVSKVAAIVGEGGSLSRAMKRVGFFPPLLIDMVAVGEQTGDLESALERAAHRYDKELGKTIEKVSALIQPVIVFIMAGVVGMMAYLMISIIFETISGVNSAR